MSKFMRTKYSLRRASKKKKTTSGSKLKKSLMSEKEESDYLANMKRRKRSIGQDEEDFIEKELKHFKPNFLHEDDTKISLEDMTNSTRLNQTKEGLKYKGKKKRPKTLKGISSKTKSMVNRLRSSKRNLRKELFDDETSPVRAINFSTYRKKNLRMLDSCPKKKVIIKKKLVKSQNSSKNKSSSKRRKKKFKTPSKIVKEDKMKFDPTKHFLRSPSKLSRKKKIDLIMEKVKGEQARSTNSIKHKLRNFKPLKLSERIQEYKELSKRRCFSLNSDLYDLLNSFKFGDNIFSLLNQKHKTNCAFLSEISNRVLKTHKTNFEEIELRRILHLEEKLFKVNWELNERRNEEELLLKIPRDENELGAVLKEFLSRREEDLREAMYEFVKGFHEEFLKKRKLKYDYTREKCWHSDFDLSKEVPHVPLAKLPQKPKEGYGSNKKLQTFFKNDDNFKNSKKSNFKKMLENSNAFAHSSKGKMEEEKLSFEDLLIMEIQRKEKMLKDQAINRENMNGGFGIKGKRIEIVRIATSIKIIYHSRNVNNMFLVKVINKVYKANKLNLMSHAEIKTLIEGIVLKSEGWLKLVDNRDGTILRIDKSKCFNKVLKKLKKIK